MVRWPTCSRGNIGGDTLPALHPTGFSATMLMTQHWHGTEDTAAQLFAMHRKVFASGQKRFLTRPWIRERDLRGRFEQVFELRNEVIYCR